MLDNDGNFRRKSYKPETKRQRTEGIIAAIGQLGEASAKSAETLGEAMKDLGQMLSSGGGGNNANHRMDQMEAKLGNLDSKMDRLLMALGANNNNN